LLNFQLAVKSFGNRSLRSEVLIVLGLYLLYLAPVLSRYFAYSADLGAQTCRLWIVMCEPVNLSSTANWSLGSIMFLLSLLSFLIALKSEGIIGGVRQ
jgi:hypothetical protein